MAWYQTGTVSGASGQKVVTGAGGAAFNGNVQPGDAFRITATDWSSEIVTVDTNTQITLRDNLPSTLSASAYSIWPTVARDVALTEAVQDLVDEFQGVVDEAGAGMFATGTVSAPSVRCVTNQNTGVNFAGSGVVEIVSGGASVMEVGDGIVGINSAPVTGVPFRVASVGAATGMEFVSDANEAMMLSYDRGTSAYKRAVLQASEHYFKSSVSTSHDVKIGTGGLGVGGTATDYGAGYKALQIIGSNVPVLDWVVGSTRTGTILSTSTYFKIGSVTNVPINFETNNTQQMLLDTSGRLLVGQASSGGDSGVIQATQVATGAGGTAITGTASHASFAYHIIRAAAVRSASSAFSFYEAHSNYPSSSDLEFRVRGDGEVTADGSFTGSGADFAEWREWSDKNLTNEDRRGMVVVLDEALDGTIRLATANDSRAHILGAVSATPTIVGGGDMNRWRGKYQRDRFGAYIMEDYEAASWQERQIATPAIPEVAAVIEPASFGDDGVIVPSRIITPAVPATPATYKTVNVSHPTDALPEGIVVPADATVSTQQRRKLSPLFDPEQPYTPRADRPEWAAIGVCGFLKVLVGQTVGDRWIKSASAVEGLEEWFVR